jgi:hypothetical protein
VEKEKRMVNLYQNRVAVDFISGGAMQAYASASRADVIVLIDSLEELESVPDAPRLIKVPMGGEDTVLSLLERLCVVHPGIQPLLDEYRQGTNLHLGSGMAQDPRLGACAIQDFDDRGELSQLFEEIFTRVLEAGNGKLDLLIVSEFNSNAGGMGAGGGPEIGGRFCVFAAKKTAAKIRRRMLRLGGLTFARVAPRAIYNAGHTTQANVSFMLDAVGPAGELRDLELYELPLRSEAGVAIRDNRLQRSVLAATLAQARNTDEVKHELSRIEVNLVAKSRFGGMLRGQAWWSHMLDATLLMRAAAASYRQQLKALRQAPDPAAIDLVQRIEVELEAQGASLPSVDTLMQLVRQRHTVQSALLDDVVAANARAFQSTVWVYMAQAQSGALHDILEASERPKALTEFRSRCQRLRGLLVHLEQAREAAQNEVNVQTRACDKQRQRLKETIRRLRSLWYHLDVMVQTRSKFLRRVQATFEAYYTAHARSSEAVARFESLSAAVEQVARTLADYEAQWLTRIEQGLEAVMGKWMAQLDTVVFAPLDAVYTKLIDATLRSRIQMDNGKEARALAVLQPVLLGAVSQVTLAGLAEMLESAPEPGAILTAIEDQRFAYSAPLWGGATSYEKPRYRFVVLPPVAAADLEALKQAAKERQFAPVLEVAESATAGCCIVALDFYGVSKMGDVLPPIYTGTNGMVARNDQIAMAVASA